MTTPKTVEQVAERHGLPLGSSGPAYSNALYALQELESAIEKSRQVIRALCQALEDYGCDSQAMLVGEPEIDWGDEEDEDWARRQIDYAIGLRKELRD